ncbi:MAG TPA: glycosyltransferase family 39 protein [Candidatus Saccharimonadales bacterium]|nr:glycosyltransferase family 39 protein [Candidatus Saccharimonadales bacterium]
MQKQLIYFFLTLIVIAAFILRIYQNASHPAGFFCDEAGLTYEAYSIATTGKDSLGNTLPFYFTVFSPRGPVAIYDQVPFIWLFGLNEFTSRFSSALFGAITIIIVFFLTKELSKNNITALFTSFLTAVSPWHIQFSRFGTENIRLPLYFALFLLFFLLGIKKQKKHMYVVLSIIFLFAAFYSYTAAAVFILPFLMGFIVIYRNYFLKHKLLSLILFGLVIFCSIPFIYQMTVFPEKSRFSEVSIFKEKTVGEASFAMIKTYVQSYSPDFLFFKGDAGMPGHFITRFSVKGFGELYIAALPFFLFGLFIVIKKVRKKENQLLLLWLLLYPLGSVVAGADGGGPFATRSIIGVLVFQIITAIGIMYFLTYFKEIKIRIAVGLGVILLFLISCSIYIYTYFVQYPLYSEDFWGWQFGARDITHYFELKKTKYDEEIMAPEFNAPDIFFKFYAPHRCNICKIGLPEDSFDPHIKQLFAVTPLYLQQHPEFRIEMQKRIIYPNGTTAFFIGEIQKIPVTMK